MQLNLDCFRKGFRVPEAHSYPKTWTGEIKALTTYTYLSPDERPMQLY